MKRVLFALVVLASVMGCTSPKPVVSVSPTVSSNASPGVGYKLAPSPSPGPVGTPVAAEVLAPAKVMPAVALCTTPVQVYQDGNAGPLFCRSGAINVAAWRWFENLRPAVMAAGPGLTASGQEAALCAKNGDNMTNPELDSAYRLAATYYGWKPIDIESFLVNPVCP